ncbi:MAG TPA: putative Fe-S cluster assembly protein SufT [Chthoniobacteraceae bacterium]
MNESITLSRDVEAIQVPSGDAVVLPAGASVVITQALGGSYTVHAADGGLFRIRPQDASALGQETTEHRIAEGPFEEAKVWEQLRNCYDPEIPLNIVDLGLIYGVEADDEPDSAGKRVVVRMTLTAPGCGMGPSLAADAQQRILTLPGVADAKVELVWDPPWSPDRISRAGREKLGME